MSVKMREEMAPVLVDRKGLTFYRDDLCLVKVDGNREVARVVDPKVELDPELPVESAGELIRKLTDQDREVLAQNERLAREARALCLARVQAHNLPMKLIRAQYSFDRSKVRFFFTAEGRIDFRELVKDLAGHLRTRIEMRQVGARDEARLLGGYGVCGQQLCCARFLSRFEPVSIKMAKEQNLALNPTKISGVCGRLMCCLSYEVETYIAARRRAPKTGTRLKTERGEMVVTALHALRDTITVEENGTSYEIPLAELAWERK
ncbi:stage 0 sporulation protein [bacterium]|nr:stage 0 sporulation protein [bacterium]